jgi:hypothetical protein
MQFTGRLFEIDGSLRHGRFVVFEPITLRTLALFKIVCFLFREKLNRNSVTGVSGHRSSHGLQK